jgi:hypothetical protein
MAGLLRASGFILGFALLFYAAAVLLLLLAMPLEGGRLDTGSVFTDRWAYRLEERYLATNVWSIGEKRDRIVFLGASAARQTFRPALLQPSLPGVELDNLSIEGANISVSRKTLHLIYQAMPVDWRGHTTFVLGVTYTNFVQNRIAFTVGSDNLATELRRFGLYREDKDGVFDARLPPAVMRAAMLLMRPLLAVPYLREIATEIVPSDLRERLNLLLRRREPGDEMTRRLEALDHQSDAVRDAFVVTPDLRDWLVHATAISVGGDHALPAEQFLELEKLAREVEAHRDRLVIVDMPLPRWHVQGLRQHTDSYREEMAATMRRLLARPNIAYLDFRTLDDSGNFVDAAHPKPRLRRVLMTEVGKYLRSRAEAELPPISRANAAAP